MKFIKLKAWRWCVFFGTSFLHCGKWALHWLCYSGLAFLKHSWCHDRCQEKNKHDPTCFCTWSSMYIYVYHSAFCALNGVTSITSRVTWCLWNGPTPPAQWLPGHGQQQTWREGLNMYLQMVRASCLMIFLNYRSGLCWSKLIKYSMIIAMMVLFEQNITHRKKNIKIGFI